MSDSIYIDIHQSIHAESDEWYKCVQLLGTGANAVTYLVLSTSGITEGVLFALKIFRRLSEDQRRERFLEEIRLLQGCDHPSIMKVHDSGVFHTAGGDFPFVVAEYLPLTLREVIRSRAAPMTQRISYALQLLSGLAFLEDLDPPVVHRDIKPDNVFVKGRSCVLGDFGLHKILDGTEEPDREIFKESLGPGMPFFYRTPDLIAYARNEAPITTKSDVFQLGLVLAELFTGWNPARRPDDILDDFEMDDLRSIPGRMSGGIAALIRRMLVVEAEEREAASQLLDGWQGVFEEAVTLAHDLEGRAL